MPLAIKRFKCIFESFNIGEKSGVITMVMEKYDIKLLGKASMYAHFLKLYMTFIST